MSEPLPERDARVSAVLRHSLSTVFPQTRAKPDDTPTKDDGWGLPARVDSPLDMTMARSRRPRRHPDGVASRASLASWLGVGTAVVAAVGALVFNGVSAVATNRQIALSREQAELTRQGQLTDRYGRAVEQLGSGAVDVRLGGVYALERLMRDSPSDQPTIVEVLSAFIRNRLADRPSVPTPTAVPGVRDMAGIRMGDVSAVFSVLSRRDVAHDGPGQRVDLSGTNLGGLDLNGINLAGANLDRADLRGSRLNRADLSGAALRDANLTGAFLGGADLSGSFLDRAQLGFAQMIFVQMPGASLEGADLSGAYLNGGDLRDANLPGADLSGADLPAANLARARLVDADLTGADLTNANLTGTMLSGATLAGVDLSAAKGLDDAVGLVTPGPRAPVVVPASPRPS
jgi:uncharacterized protein YjbI with pentapeptide repeats/membrane protein implicated in regulation of membrane protease activity